MTFKTLVHQDTDTSRTERTNYQWLNDLQHNGSPRPEAIHDLYEFLERGIYHYLSQEYSNLVGRPDLRQIAQNIAKDSLRRILDELGSFLGVSQFTTWAAKIAARVATTNLMDIHSIQLTHEPLDPVASCISLKMSEALRVEQSELVRPLRNGKMMVVVFWRNRCNGSCKPPALF